MTMQSWIAWSELARNIALTVGPFIGAWIAWRGLSTWQRERAWDRNEHVASHLLKSVFEFREGILQFRREGMTKAEQDLVGEWDENFTNFMEVAMAGMGPFYQHRLLALGECAAKLRSAVGEAKYTWDGDVPIACFDLLAEEGRIRQYLFEFYFSLPSYSGDKRRAALVEFEKKSGLLTLSTGDGPERLKWMNDCIEEIEKFLKTKVRSPQ